MSGRLASDWTYQRCLSVGHIVSPEQREHEWQRMAAQVALSSCPGSPPAAFSGAFRANPFRKLLETPPVRQSFQGQERPAAGLSPDGDANPQTLADRDE